MKHIFMSIHPRFAESIIKGQKTYELRRRRVSAEPGDQICLYETSPKKKVTAICTVKSVLSTDLDSLWETVKEKCGVAFDEFRTYFNGLSTGCAVEVSDVRPLQSSLTLYDLREAEPQFRPPQSYCFLKKNSGVTKLFDLNKNGLFLQN